MIDSASKYELRSRQRETNILESSRRLYYIQSARQRKKESRGSGLAVAVRPSSRAFNGDNGDCEQQSWVSIRENIVRAEESPENYCKP